MAWKDVSPMSQRAEFVVLATAEGANVSALCRRFGVSRKTGDKWLSRYAAEGARGWRISLVIRGSRRVDPATTWNGVCWRCGSSIRRGVVASGVGGCRI